MTSERPHPDPRVPGDSDPVDATADDAALLAAPVSYTHLTLPTKRIV